MSGGFLMTKIKWSLKEQCQFLKRIGELLSRGYPLAGAIESVTLHLSADKKNQVAAALNDLKEGHPFHQILHTIGFNQHLIGYVFFAEQHGGLESAFLEGSEMMLKRGSDLKKLKQLAVYPSFLMCITAILFFFVEAVLLPRFTTLFNSMNLQENTFTKMIRFISEYLPLCIFLIILIAVTCGFYYFFFFKKIPRIKQASIFSSLPVAGAYIRLFYTHFFTIHLHYLLSAGLSIYEAFSLFEKNQKQPLYQEVGLEMKRRLRSGEKMEELLAEYSFLENELYHVINHGQNNGRLEQELYYFSKHCLRQLENKTDQLLKIIQPVMYSVIGFLIVTMYLAVLLPMFHLLEGI